jgi:hypothetical protein
MNMKKAIAVLVEHASGKRSRKQELLQAIEVAGTFEMGCSKACSAVAPPTPRRKEKKPPE